MHCGRRKRKKIRAEGGKEEKRTEKCIEEKRRDVEQEEKRSEKKSIGSNHGKDVVRDGKTCDEHCEHEGTKAGACENWIEEGGVLSLIRAAIVNEGTGMRLTKCPRGTILAHNGSKYKSEHRVS